jgi:hypothetical protein
LSDVVLQGVACRFGEVIDDGTKLLYLRPGCFTEHANVKLLFDHKGNSLASTDNRLEVHVGQESLVFRFHIPESWTEQFKNQADDLDTYLPVSCGFSITKSELIAVDGAQIKVVTEATLNEISLISEEPAVKATFARVVGADSCNDLADDCERMELIGRYISLHRKAKASENGGVVRYAHATSPSDRAADRFTKALSKLL